jgi:hypothetical protein
MLETYAISGLGSVTVLMLGAIWYRIGKLDDKFEKFDGDCRVRHESVMQKEDYWREHIPLERSCEALHSRVDKLEVRLSMPEIDRR